ECQSLAADGVTPREGAERLKKNRFYVEKLFEQAANFTADELRDAIVRLAELDLALKGGSRLAGEFEFSRALVDLTRPREATPVVWPATFAGSLARDHQAPESTPPLSRLQALPAGDRGPWLGA